MPQLRRTTEELGRMPARQTAAGADVFEDLFTSFFGGPGKPGAAMGLGIPGVNLPVGQVTSGLRGLGPVTMSGGTGVPGGRVGMLGGNVELPLQQLMRMAKSIAKNPQDAEDVYQAGVTAALSKAQKKPMSGPDILRTARSEMKHWTPAGGQGTGVRTKDRLLVEKVQTQLGDQGHDKWVARLQEMDPKGGWTLERLRNVQAGKRQANVSIDQLSQELREPSADPGRLAEFRQEAARKKALPKMETPISDAEQLIVTEPKKPQRSGGFKPGNKAGARLTPKPISGGAPGPEDLSAEFPSHAFRLELGRQPRQMFGQEGFQAKHPGDPTLARVLADLENLHARMGGGNQRTVGAIPESQHHTLGAVRLTEDWDRLRSILGNLGRFQGRN